MKISNQNNQVANYQGDSTGKVGGEAKAEKKSSFMSFARDLFDKGTSLRFGSVAESICDRLGLPEGVGDVAGICVSLGTMNFPEVTEHAADLVKDIAAKNGNEKLAGFCEKYEQKVGKFNQIVGKLGFMVGSTLATGGAGAALGASTGAVSVGGVSMSAAQLFQGVSVLDSAIGVGESWERGDKMGALTGALGVLGGVGGMGEVFGMSAEQSKKLIDFAGKAQQGVGMYQNAMADGKLDLKDLGALPWMAMLDKAGVDTDKFTPQQQQLMGGLAQVLGSEDPSATGVNLLTSVLLDRAFEQMDVKPGESDPLAQALAYFGESMRASGESPDALALLGQLLKESGHGVAGQDMKAYQFTPLKA